VRKMRKGLHDLKWPTIWFRSSGGSSFSEGDIVGR